MFDIDALASTLTACLENAGIRFALDRFPSGAIMIDAHISPQTMLVVQMHAGQLGFSKVFQDEPVDFTTVPEAAYESELAFPEAFDHCLRHPDERL